MLSGVAKDGAVRFSGQPVMAVLNTTSPAAEVNAPEDSPWISVPSSRTSFTWVIECSAEPGSAYERSGFFALECKEAVWS